MSTPHYSLEPIQAENAGHFLVRDHADRIFMRVQRPDGASRGIVVITHGLGEHSGRYGHVAEKFSALGLRVVTWDLRGHGRSSGERGDAMQYNLLIDDLEAVCACATEEGGPLILFAHSLGGQLVLRFLEERQPACAGAVIASPWLRLAFDPPWWKLALARMALKIFPRFAQKTGTSWARLSRDFEHLASFPDLDLTHHLISARLYFAVRAGGEAALADAARLHLPLLLVHGDQDPITSHHATRELFEHVSSPDKTLRVCPGVLHETHNDLDRAIVLQEICDWLEARLPGAGTAGMTKSE